MAQGAPSGHPTGLFAIRGKELGALQDHLRVKLRLQPLYFLGGPFKNFHVWEWEGGRMGGGHAGTQARAHARFAMLKVVRFDIYGT